MCSTRAPSSHVAVCHYGEPYNAPASNPSPAFPRVQMYVPPSKVYQINSTMAILNGTEWVNATATWWLDVQVNAREHEKHALLELKNASSGTAATWLLASWDSDTFPCGDYDTCEACLAWPCSWSTVRGSVIT